MADNAPCPLNGHHDCKTIGKNNPPKDSTCTLCEIANAWGTKENVYEARKRWLVKCGIPATNAKKPNKF